MKAFPQGRDVKVVDDLTTFDNGPTPAILVDDLDVLSERQANQREIAAKTSEISRIEEERRSDSARIEAERKDHATLILKSIADMQAKHDADNRALQKEIADLQKEIADLKTQVGGLRTTVGNQDEVIGEMNEKLEELEELKEENGKLVSRVALLENLPRTLNV